MDCFGIHWNRIEFNHILSKAIFHHDRLLPTDFGPERVVTTANTRIVISITDHNDDDDDGIRRGSLICNYRDWPRARGWLYFTLVVAIVVPQSATRFYYTSSITGTKTNKEITGFHSFHRRPLVPWKTDSLSFSTLRVIGSPHWVSSASSLRSGVHCQRTVTRYVSELSLEFSIESGIVKLAFFHRSKLFAHYCVGAIAWNTEQHGPASILSCHILATDRKHRYFRWFRVTS